MKTPTEILIKRNPHKAPTICPICKKTARSQQPFWGFYRDNPVCMPCLEIHAFNKLDQIAEINADLWGENKKDYQDIVNNN